MMMADLIIKATAVLAAGWIAAFVLRRRSAAARHAVWAGLVGATLMLPLTALLLPALEIPLLPAAARAERVVTPSPIVLTATAPGDAEPVARARDAEAAPPQEMTAAPAWWQTLSTRQIAMGAWLLIALALIARMAAAHLQARGLLRACADASGRLEEAAAAVAGALGVRTPAIRIAPTGMMPAVIGITRPSIILPADAEQWSDERLQLVLLHECAHVRRRDTLMQAVSSLATAAYWWHPLAWIAARHIVRERELACDDMVIASGTPAARYAEHLIDIARAMKSSRQPALAALAMARPSQLEGRLISLLEERPRASASSRALTSGLLIAAAAALAIAPVKLVARAALVDDTTITSREQTAPSPDQAAAPVAKPAPQPTASAALNAALLKATSDEDEDVRAAAISALVARAVDAPQANAVLIRALSDASADVRQMALAGLVRLQSPDVVPHLAAALKDTSEDVRTVAVAGLRRMDHPQKRELLLQAVADASEDVRTAVALALADVTGAAVNEALVRLAKDESEDVRRASIMALARAEGFDASALLISSLTDRSADVRAAAAMALGSLGDKRAVQSAIRGFIPPAPEPAPFAPEAPDAPAVPPAVSATDTNVHATGFVQNAGKYVWREGLTVADLLREAGGIADRGTMTGLTILRAEGDRTVSISATSATVLRPGDHVNVPRRRF